MATFTVMFCDDEDDSTIKEFSQMVQAAYDSDEGFFGGNFIVVKKDDDDSEFWRKWEEGVQTAQEAVEQASERALELAKGAQGDAMTALRDARKAQQEHDRRVDVQMEIDA